MDDMSRRSFIKSGLMGIVGGVPVVIHASDLPSRRPTPAEIRGPFYPVSAQKDTDFDLTRVTGRAGVAQGTVIVVEGRVVDTSDAPISDASVELWQANAAGRYAHPHDPNRAPIDVNFQGWAIVPTGDSGRFRFKTVYPGTYPAADGWVRPPHIHFKVTKLGYIDLITQMYFPGHELNEHDWLLGRKSESERELMTASKSDERPDLYTYKIVLQPA